MRPGNQPATRLLITGASGNVGRSLSRLAADNWETTGTYFSSPATGGGRAVRLDIRERDAVLALVRDVRPGVIIHAATSDQTEAMAETNRIAAEHITEAAASAGARLIALSTDLVFDGTSPPYGEADPPTPVNLYGRVKAQNETTFLAYPRSLIVRTSLVYDFDRENRQVSWMLDAVERGEPVRLFVDEFRNAIWVWNLAEALLEAAAHDATGILHIAGPEAITRLKLGQVLLREMGFNPTEIVTPVRAAEVAPHRPQRPLLRIDKARQILKTPLLSLDEAVRRAKALPH
jgi:dTDP-4-dehydrorhamnose reductase